MDIREHHQQQIAQEQAECRAERAPLLAKLKLGQKYPYRYGGLFEFRYVFDETYGFVFGLLNGRDAYVAVQDLDLQERT